MSCCPETTTLIRTNADGTQTYINENGTEFPLFDVQTSIEGPAGEQVYVSEDGTRFPILIPDVCELLSSAVDGGFAVL